MKFDCAVIGAGAAGMMCAAVAGQRGKRVVLIDHANKLAEKIRISGGGRCNFTNLNASPENYLSQNPHFCKSALSRYTPQDFLSLIKRYRVAYHEKHKGQLFCDHTSEDIIRMLKTECDQGQVTWRKPCKVAQIRNTNGLFFVDVEGETIAAKRLVIATGGLSIPAIGASDFAYRIAQQFEIPVVETYPGLVPLTFDTNTWKPWSCLSGISLPVRISVARDKKRISFDEDLLLTHRGLSGPAILQISSFFRPGNPLFINVLPANIMGKSLIQDKRTSKKNIGNVLAVYLPSRFIEAWLLAQNIDAQIHINDLTDKQLQSLGESLNAWHLLPQGSEGYRKAEVTCGGISTQALSQQTMEVNRCPGLHFIGEAVDVTGWLGGYNFQWAWASGVAAGLSI